MGERFAMWRRAFAGTPERTREKTVRLTVIGCSGSYPGPDSPASCYLLEQEHEGRTWRVLMDLGSAVLSAPTRLALASR